MRVLKAQLRAVPQEPQNKSGFSRRGNLFALLASTRDCTRQSITAAEASAARRVEGVAPPLRWLCWFHKWAGFSTPKPKIPGDFPPCQRDDNCFSAKDLPPW
jgi:hypothetical protein